MLTDPIADLITRLRNAQKARQETTTAPYSKQKEAILKVLATKQYIKQFEIDKSSQFPQLKIFLNLELPSLYLKRISKPGQRIYSNRKGIKPVIRGLGTSIVSTSKGIMTDQEARKKQLGGEILFEVY